MSTKLVARRAPATLPADDTPSVPQRAPWAAEHAGVRRAVDHEVDRRACRAISAGVYHAQHGESAVHDAVGRYHPFDGDGMLHSLFIDRRRRSEYRNRFIRTDGFCAELRGARPLWAGLIGERQSKSSATAGARERMKDASSTDVVVHGGRRRNELLPVWRHLRARPSHARAQIGKAAGTGRLTPGWGCRRTPRSTRPTARCCSSTTRKRRRTCTTAWSNARGSWRTTCRFRCRDRACRTTWRSPSALRF